MRERMRDLLTALLVPFILMGFIIWGVSLVFNNCTRKKD